MSDHSTDSFILAALHPAENDFSSKDKIKGEITSLSTSYEQIFCFCHSVSAWRSFEVRTIYSLTNREIRAQNRLAICQSSPPWRGAVALGLGVVLVLGAAAVIVVVMVTVVMLIRASNPGCVGSLRIRHIV